MSKYTTRSGVYTLFILFIVGLFFLGNEVERHQSMVLFFGYFTVFFSYVFLALSNKLTFNQILWLGIIGRMVLFPHLPVLSDDFYRFVWDGMLIHNGINPYQFLPGEIPISHPDFDKLFHNLNSPNYFTVYPPFNQLIFWLSVVAEDDILIRVNLIRVILFTADIGSLFLLRRLSRGNLKPLSWFFLNPLLILEVVGNLHFEGLVITFILLALVMLTQNRWWSSGISIGLAMGTKLIPAIFLPGLLFSQPWKKGLGLTVIALITASILLLPMVSVMTSESMSSFRLYFQNFEFNASWYYLFREIGFWQVGYNTIQTLGPKLAKWTFALILIWSIWGKFKGTSESTILLFSLFIYLGLATTIHPWYSLPLLPLGLLSGYYFPVVWSFLIFFTYFGYNETDYQLPMYWIMVEYTLVYAVLIYEVYQKNVFKTVIR